MYIVILVSHIFSFCVGDTQEKCYINIDPVFALNCLSSVQKWGQYLYRSLPIHISSCTSLTCPPVSLLSPTGGNDVDVLSKSRILRTESLPSISAFVESSFNPPSVFPCTNTLSPLCIPDRESVFRTNSSDLVRYFGYLPLRFCVGGFGNFASNHYTQQWTTACLRFIKRRQVC